MLKNKNRKQTTKKIASTAFTSDAVETPTPDTEDKKSFKSNEDSVIVDTEKKDDDFAAAKARRDKRRESRRATGSLKGLSLTSTPIPGYQLRFVNDKGDRIKKLEAEGWSLVRKTEVDAYSSDAGDKISQVGGGDGVKQVLMKIPNEFYDEDRAEKRGVIAKRSADLRKASTGSESLGTSHSYVPKGSNSHFETD